MKIKAVGESKLDIPVRKVGAVRSQLIHFKLLNTIKKTAVYKSENYLSNFN